MSMKCKSFSNPKTKASFALLFFVGLLVWPFLSTALSQEARSLIPDYRPFPIGAIGSRTAIWFVAQLHLTFAAFILGVPLFAVIIETVGHLTKNKRYDKLAKDFIRLCLMAYSITALFGGALLFSLIILYPKFWNYMVQIFSPTMYFYAFLLLIETFTLYIYYYLWDFLQESGKERNRYPGLGEAAGWAFVATCTSFIIGEVFFSRLLIQEIFLPLSGSPVTALSLFLGFLILAAAFCFPASRKVFHICLGTLLNLLGTTLMVTANLWLTFMTSPGHTAYNETGEKFTQWAINPKTGELLSFVTTILNETWQPINIHRFIANVCVGGIIAAAYAAFRFLNAKTQEERAYYDWMGYTGNFVAMIALIPLPFAGYYLGREVYAWNEQMGVNMMGGHFSWFFIMQAVLIAVMFLGANYYLWLGLGRIPGGQRYMKFIGWMELLLVVSFLVWITPHNPVATRAEVVEIGGPFHPLLAPFGVMAFKLTVINAIILTTFLSFIFYRRANKQSLVEFTPRGKLVQGAGIAFLMILVLGVGYLDFTGGSLSPREVGKPMDLLNTNMLKSLLFLTIIASIIINYGLWLQAKGKKVSQQWDRVGITFQQLLFAFTFIINLWLGYHGYLSDDATRLNDAIWQVVWVLSCMVLVTATDIFCLIPAGSIGEIRWGEMPVRSQYVLFMIAVAFVLTMSLMGTVRSGLRGPWHVFGYMKDTSLESFHPSLAFSSQMWALTTFVFFLLVALIFWLGSLGEKGAETGKVAEFSETGKVPAGASSEAAVKTGNPSPDSAS
ncbi:MAG: cytochrome ubiquinol oxidase subunit I [Candidatus Binatia bacterium]